MVEKYRIGVLGLTHDHVWQNLEDLKASGRGQLVAAADPHPELLERVQEEHGCTAYTDYNLLLDGERLDAVYIFADNAGGAFLTERAAKKGLHVLIEKPMAASLEGADRMLLAVRQAGSRLMVNWPFAWWPQLQHAIRLAQSGMLGELWQVKYRAAHEGPKELGCSSYFCDWLYDPARNGAGALMDYCCYGAALARTLLGVPSRVAGVAGRLCKEDILTEDNAVLVLSYPRAIAMTEGSWTQIGKLTAYQTAIYGTKGTLFVEPRRGGRLILATAEKPDGEDISVPEPPAELRSATAHFLSGIQAKQPFLPLCSDRIGRDTQEILEAGLRSVERGCEVSLPLKR